MRFVIILRVLSTVTVKKVIRNRDSRIIIVSFFELHIRISFKVPSLAHFRLSIYGSWEPTMLPLIVSFFHFNNWKIRLKSADIKNLDLIVITIKKRDFVKAGRLVGFVILENISRFFSRIEYFHREKRWIKIYLSKNFE